VNGVQKQNDGANDAFADFDDVDTDDLVEVLPTMSKTDALLQCAWRWGRRAPRDPGGEPARFGSACHEVYAKLASSSAFTKKELKTWCVEAADRFAVDAREVQDIVKASWPEFNAWMSGKNPWNQDFTRCRPMLEYSVAYDVVAGTTRECDAPDDVTHSYKDRDLNELPGTADIVFWRHKEYLCVLDYKTGYDIPEPCNSGQMLSLALALSKLYTTRMQVIVGFMHAPRGGGGLPTVYADTVSLERLEEHAEALRAAWRIRGTSMTPGEWCKYCPAFTICPTQSSMLVELRRGANGAPLTKERVGAIHQQLASYDALAKQLRAQLRGYVAKHGAVARPDGKILDLVEREYESLSKSSIEEALGLVEASKEIGRLRKKGCVKQGKRLELRAENERGR
jgi:hypothetical protein